MCEYRLKLADGARWIITANDSPAGYIVSRFAEVMQLQPWLGKVEQSHQASVNKLLVLADSQKRTPVHENEETIFFKLHEDKQAEMVYQFLNLSLVICRHAQSRGALLLHGALARLNGYGIILAGSGGAGKTTASQRLPKPWHALSDDATLIVRDREGRYFSHPWPTWSTFMFGGTGGSWDVQDAVPLKGIFFLEQADDDSIEQLTAGKAVCMLVEAARQVSSLMSENFREEDRRLLHLERFDNICNLVKEVPCNKLSLSLTGNFWDKIEQVLNERSVSEK